MNRLIVVMGVAGSGKSTVGAALAGALASPFLEGDAFHPPANIKKQAGGLPLDNSDRVQWIDNMAGAITRSTAPTLVLACSALNDFVRDSLVEKTKRDCVWVLLDAPQEVLAERMQSRKGHFMPPELLASQLAALEPPADCFRIDATEGLPQILDTIGRRLGAIKN
jgi:carbohydrate kinase (thermoresistant glucokinase family)